MKKVLMILFSFLVASSTVFVNPSIQPNFAAIDKNDAHYLFHDGANVVVLDQSEMEDTKGKWVWNTLSGLVNGTFSAWGYSMQHPYDSTLSGFGNAFLGGFAGGFIAPSITWRTGLSYFAGGYFGSMW